MKLRRFLTTFVLVSAFAATGALAQETTPPPSSDQSSSADTQAAPDQQKQDKKDKKDKKKKNKKDKGSEDQLNTSDVFNERVANDVLGQIRDGLEGHSRRLLLSAFDDDKMDGYLSFEDQIDAFFNHYEGFRVQFRIAQTTTEGNKGIILVDTQLEEMPAGGAAPPRRKSGQLRFELERGRKGWKVVDFRDRSFFS